MTGGEGVQAIIYNGASGVSRAIAFNQGNPSNRRSGESRNPGNPHGKERDGYRAFWIPAFAGTTVLLPRGILKLIKAR